MTAIRIITVAYSSVSRKGVVTYTNTSASCRWRIDELPESVPADSGVGHASTPVADTAKKN